LTRVEVTHAALQDLERLIAVLTLPADTRARVKASLAPLERFPLLGPKLSGRWQGLRFILGPWRWMLIVYEYIGDEDRAVILTIQDARSSTAVTNG
jgi:hypothetical protein